TMDDDRESICRSRSKLFVTYLPGGVVAVEESPSLRKEFFKLILAVIQMIPLAPLFDLIVQGHAVGSSQESVVEQIEDFFTPV
ncbi:MAG: hypothetical protein HW387_448, partial [Parachlamydiales bacterium]|nr:hypothetical protein [Parachlamydiales bacterium]